MPALPSHATPVRVEIGTCMACYRLTFESQQTFEILIDGKRAAQDYPTEIYTATIYRVTGDAREAEPLHREAGGPLEIYAVSDLTALAIVTEVLKEVTDSSLATVSACNEPLPLLPLLDLI